MKNENRKQYSEEVLVLNIAKSIPGVQGRFSTAEEDCGYHKSDVVLSFEGRDYHVQVSRQEKSKKQRANLSRRGTYPIHTNFFQGDSEPKRIARDLQKILGLDKI